MQFQNDIKNLRIKSDVVIFTKDDVEFVQTKRYENNIKMDEIFAHFVVKYKKNEIMTSDITEYEHKVWLRFDEKYKKIETMIQALKDNRVVAVTLKEYHFLFEEKPLLYF
jgi:hypothetical protein